MVAIEPAAGLRQILERKLAVASQGQRASVRCGFFDDLPVPSDFADLVVACSVLTPAPGHGGDARLAEMERVCRPGGCVAIIWPNNISWLAARDYRYESFPDRWPWSSPATARRWNWPGSSIPMRSRKCAAVAARVPYEVLGINPPRDLAFKVITG